MNKKFYTLSKLIQQDWWMHKRARTTQLILEGKLPAYNMNNEGNRPAYYIYEEDAQNYINSNKM